MPQFWRGTVARNFPHWIKQHGECDTREVVLSRDGIDVQQDEECRAVSGTWFSAYDSRVFATSGQLDIDHIVPLANAWRSGAHEWATPRRRTFANDLVHAQPTDGTARVTIRYTGAEECYDLDGPPGRVFVLMNR
ncbi:hypothetical protein [Streptomyces sp. NPDC001657]|uniref:hypothetical protein n=1 Tax=Streptomyces sp. NPDC001657 TaxID=3154522 RepID=UPI00332046DB